LRTRSRWYLASAATAVVALAICGQLRADARLDDDIAGPLSGIRLPEGFRIEVFVSKVPNARSMALGQTTLFVGSRQAGKVYAVPLETDEAGTPRAGEPLILASGLYQPNGVAFRDGSLYVAEVNRILRADAIEQRLQQPVFKVVTDQLPSLRHHGWRYIAFGPDGRLYVPIGAPCNVCDRRGYAVITRMAPDGSRREIFAEGVRNTVGFAWQPGTEVMWFTDNGRDWLGDDLPPDELNRAPQAGLHFGFPYCHGGNVPDPELAGDRRCDEFTPPAIRLGAHVAPLGLSFYTGDSFPAQYRGRIFIAEHGSWNRSEPVGYRITLVDVEGNRADNYRVFAEGWLKDDGEAWGRPVDLLVLPDGSMLVSDDRAGQIYRIYYADGKR